METTVNIETFAYVTVAILGLYLVVLFHNEEVNSEGPKGVATAVTAQGIGLLTTIIGMTLAIGCQDAIDDLSYGRGLLNIAFVGMLVWSLYIICGGLNDLKQLELE